MQSELANERITWVKPEVMHLTIKFFGEIPQNSIPSIEHCLGQAACSVTEFSIAIVATGIFGSSYQPRVIWFGIKEPEPVKQLATEVNEQLKTIGILPDRQNFVPHLTIARIKQINNLHYLHKVIGRHKILDGEPEHIGEIALYESILHKYGPVYTALKSFELKASLSKNSFN